MYLLCCKLELYHNNIVLYYVTVAPIPVVVISAAVRHDYYGVRDDNGDLQ